MSYVTARNWLEDLEDADDDNQDGVQCVRDANSIAESYHRSSVYDGSRFFWDLTTDQGVSPDRMSDVYVDMCPRGWYDGYYPSSVGPELPLVHLLYSADFHTLYTEYDNELDQLYH